MRARDMLPQLIIGIAVAAALAPPASALAGDENTVPPLTELRVAGAHGTTFGTDEYNHPFAYFRTSEPDSTWTYTAGSAVTFACAIDGTPIHCGARGPLAAGTYVLTSCKKSARSSRAMKRRSRRTRRRRRRRRRARRHGGCSQTPLTSTGLGAFEGIVSLPPGLSAGSHTVTVAATDEDGAESPPASATFEMDQ